MNYIAPIEKKAKKQLIGIADLVDYAIHEEESWIRNKIRNRWLLGKKPDGSLIGWYRSESYAEDKYQQNKKAGFGNADLTLTGALGRGIRISGFNNEYEIYSEDEKYEKIVDDWGEWNFNITEEEKTEMFKRIFNVVNTKLLNYIYG